MGQNTFGKRLGCKLECIYAEHITGLAQSRLKLPVCAETEYKQKHSRHRKIAQKRLFIWKCALKPGKRLESVYVEDTVGWRKGGYGI
jgi:hypothetical protein